MFGVPTFVARRRAVLGARPDGASGASAAGRGPAAGGARPRRMIARPSGVRSQARSRDRARTGRMRRASALDCRIGSVAPARRVAGRADGHGSANGAVRPLSPCCFPVALICSGRHLARPRAVVALLGVLLRCSALLGICWLAGGAPSDPGSASPATWRGCCSDSVVVAASARRLAFAATFDRRRETSAWMRCRSSTGRWIVVDRSWSTWRSSCWRSAPGPRRRTRTARDFFIAGQRIGLFVTALADDVRRVQRLRLLGGPGLTYRMGWRRCGSSCPSPSPRGLLCWVVARKRLRRLAGYARSSPSPTRSPAASSSRAASGLAAVAVAPAPWPTSGRAAAGPRVFLQSRSSA